MGKLDTRTNFQEIESATAIPDLSIVLVCWNNLDYLGPCLESLYKSDMQNSYDVVVVDNGSTDGSQEMLRESIRKFCSSRTTIMWAWVKPATRELKPQTAVMCFS